LTEFQESWRAVAVTELIAAFASIIVRRKDLPVLRGKRTVSVSSQYTFLIFRFCQKLSKNFLSWNLEDKNKELLWNISTDLTPVPLCSFVKETVMEKHQKF
jgi:hypothetical protein